MTTLTRETRGIRHYRRETAELDLAPQVATSTAEDGTLTATITPQATLLHADVETHDTPWGRPGSIFDPLLENVALNTAEQDATMTAFVPATMDKLGAARISVEVFAPYMEVAEPGTPLVPVWLGAWPTVANKWEQAKNRILRMGMPIDLERFLVFYENAVAKGDTDLSAVVLDPEWTSWDGLLHGSEWGAWRLRPGTPEMVAEGYPLRCTNGYRLRGTQESNGYAINRPNGKPQAGWPSSWPRGFPYPTMTDDPKSYPSDPAQMEVFEVSSGVSASVLAAGPFAITVEDIERGAIEHPISFAAPYTLIRPGFRWPAQAADGSTPGAPLQEGMRFRLDPTLDLGALGLHPLALMIARAAQKYGLVLVDRGTVMGFGAQRGVEAFYPTARRGGKGELLVLHEAPADATHEAQARFPWQSLQLLATGTEATPNPTV